MADTELLLVFEPNPPLLLFCNVALAIAERYPDLIVEDVFHTREDGRIELHIPKAHP